MARPTSPLRRGIPTLILLLTLFPLASTGGTQEPSGGLVALVKIAPPRDAVSEEQRAEIRAAIAAYEAERGPVEKEGEEPFRLPFFPQAGILGRDLFLNNFTDLDPGRGAVRDWDCSGYTYDGHQGHDSLIRTFREQEIGVPVFAALGGMVVETHDGEPDMNIAWDERNQANYVVIDHGGGHFGLYLHFRAGSVAVAPGQTVTAGTQIGLTGSSGISDWPHLHLELWKNNRWFEPSAGPCREGESFWMSQQPVARNLYVADFFMSRSQLSILDYETFIHDRATRTATFTKGFQAVDQRLDLRNLPAHSTYALRVLNPRRQIAFEISGPLSGDEFLRLALGHFRFEADLNVVGTWRYQLDLDGRRVIDTPFRVVASERQAANRKPKAVKTRLTPAKPVEGKVMTCEALSSLITEDPDYDLVAYRYEWRVNNRVVRTVTSAATTDLLAAGTAGSKDKVTCKVAVSDVR